MQTERAKDLKTLENSDFDFDEEWINWEDDEAIEQRVLAYSTRGMLDA
jgi:hypothetical protein